MQLKKLNLKFSLYFFLIAAILSVSIFFSFIANAKSYQSETKILFVFKNEKLNESPEQIIENFLEFPKYLSFYERFLEEGNFSDNFSGKSKDERKKLWAETIAVSRINDSQTIRVIAYANTEDLATTYSRQTALTLASFSARYYDLRNDIDMRVVEGPITSPYYRNFARPIFFALLAGCLLAFLTTMLVDQAVGFAEKLIFRPRKKLSFGLEKAAPVVKKEIIPEIQTAKKYQAPPNLPVIPEEKEEIIEIPEKPSGPKNYPEPTEEEIKKRLNQLLRGGL